MTIICCHSQILFLTWLSDEQHQHVSVDFYSVFSETWATQVIKTNQMAELKQISTYNIFGSVEMPDQSVRPG